MMDERTKRFALDFDKDCLLEMPETIKHFDCRPNQTLVGPIVVEKYGDFPQYKHFCSSCVFIISTIAHQITIIEPDNNLEKDEIKTVKSKILDIYLCKNSLLVRSGNEESEYWSSNPYWNTFVGWINFSAVQIECAAIRFALNEGYIKIKLIKGERYEKSDS